MLGAAFFQFGVQGVRYLDGLGVHFPGQNLILFLTPRWFFIGQQPFWFPFGLVVGLHMAEFQQWLARAKRMLLPGTVAFGSLAILEFQAADNFNGDQILNPAFAGFTRTIYVLVFLLWFLSLNEKLIPLTNQIVKVSSKSLGIYMANIPAIYITAVLMYKFTPKLLGIQPVYQGILFTAGLFGPILLMEFVRRSPARPWYRTLFG